MGAVCRRRAGGPVRLVWLAGALLLGDSRSDGPVWLDDLALSRARPVAGCGGKRSRPGTFVPHPLLELPHPVRTASRVRTDDARVAPRSPEARDDRSGCCARPGAMDVLHGLPWRGGSHSECMAGRDIPERLSLVVFQPEGLRVRHRVGVDVSGAVDEGALSI